VHFVLRDGVSVKLNNFSSYLPAIY